MAVAALSGCGGDGRERETEEGQSPGASADAETAGAREVDSEIGTKPGYFVPHQPDTPLAIVGRAELSVSGKPIELSAGAEREVPLGPAVCVNPAYHGRGQLGIYIPTTCFATPLPKLSIARVQVPEQAVRGYELVIWGVTRGVGADVIARFDDGEARPAVFSVDGRLARQVEVEQPFGVFVAELPTEASCDVITIGARSRTGRVTDPIQPKPKICRTGGRT